MRLSRNSKWKVFWLEKSSKRRVHGRRNEKRFSPSMECDRTGIVKEEGKDTGGEIWAAYRKVTRLKAPAHLAETVRARLNQAPRILPRAAVASLIVSIILTAIATFSLNASSAPLPDRSTGPPPIFGEIDKGLFQQTILHETP